MKVIRTTKAADAVLLALTRRLKAVKSQAEVAVHPYVNGRERGWKVELYSQALTLTPTVLFSENRNSDDIVVYGSARSFVDIGCNNYGLVNGEWPGKMFPVGEDVHQATTDAAEYAHVRLMELASSCRKDRSNGLE